MKKLYSLLLNDIAPHLLSQNRDIFLRQKENNESLSAILIALALNFKTNKIHTPLLPESMHSNTDCAVVDKNGKVDEIQVVSTWDVLHSSTDVNANIYKRIDDKHNKYKKNAISHIQLCVFVGQDYYQEIILDNLQSFLKKKSIFANYWLIAPSSEENRCQFYVCDIFSGKDGDTYECIIDFTPPGPIAINYLSDYQKTGKLIDINK